MLNPKVAQSIVEKTIAILGINVNIMDANAIIIASGDLTRRGKLHEGAEIAIKSGRTFEVQPSDVDGLKGVAPGISMPLFYGREIVGAVGLTGPPDEIRKYGQLVQHTTELMLEQNVLKEELYLKTRARESFIHDWLSGGAEQDEEFFLHRGKMLGYDLSLPRLVLLVEFDLNGLESNLDQNAAPEQRGQALALQRFKDDLEQQIYARYKHIFGLVTGFMGMDLAVLVSINLKKRYEEIISWLEDMGREIVAIAERQMGVAARVGIGNYRAAWQEMPRSFQEAGYALKLGSKQAPGQTVYFFEHYFTEFLLNTIPAEERRAYCREVLGPLLDQEGEHYSAELLHTLSMYFAHDMNIKETAEEIFIHRNTLMFRLNKVAEITGYQPQSFASAFQLQLALKLWRMEEPRLEG